MDDLQNTYQKTIRIVVATFLVYALLVATHLGEFWPFSIYPMFSKAGNPWNRAIVRDVSHLENDSLWNDYNHENLVGESVALDELNINTNDIANLLSKTEVWNQRKIMGVRKLFEEELNSSDLLLLQARGSLTENDSVNVEFVPYLYISRDTTILNNKLKTAQQ